MQQIKIAKGKSPIFIFVNQTYLLSEAEVFKEFDRDPVFALPNWILGSLKPELVGSFFNPVIDLLDSKKGFLFFSLIILHNFELEDSFFSFPFSL